MISFVKRIASLAVLTAVVVTAASAQGARAEADTLRLSKAGESRTVGSDTARVIILEFLDYQCPVCAAFHTQRADSLKKAAGPDVRIHYVNFPLQMHLRSFHGSEAAMCAAGIGGKPAYAAMADRLYRQQSSWADLSDPGPVFQRFAKEATIDSAAFADCRSRDAMSPIILADIDLAGRFGINGTPTFVILPRGAQSPDDASQVSGNVSIAELTSLITKARAKAK